MQRRQNGRPITPVTSGCPRHTDDSEPESPKIAVDPIGIPETVCPPIENDSQLAVIREDASQLGVSRVFVSRDHHEPPGDRLTPAPCPLSHTVSQFSALLPPHHVAPAHCRYSSVIVPLSFSTTR
jgi:hypothetical protein